MGRICGEADAGLMEDDLEEIRHEVWWKLRKRWLDH